MDEARFEALKKEIGRRYYGARISSKRDDAKFLNDVHSCVASLQKEVRRLREALEPLVVRDIGGTKYVVRYAFPGEVADFTADDLNRARAALGTPPALSTDKAEPARSAEPEDVSLGPEELKFRARLELAMFYGLKNLHVSWGEKAHELSREERFAVLNDIQDKIFESSIPQEKDNG